MFIRLEFRSLYKTCITGVPVYDPVIFAYEPGYDFTFTGVRCGHFKRMYIPCPRVNPDMDPLSKVSLIPFLYLVHFRITLSGRILGGRGRFYDAGIYDRPSVHQFPVLVKKVLDAFKQLLRYPVIV